MVLYQKEKKKKKTEIWDKLKSRYAIVGSRLNLWNTWYKNEEEQFLEIPRGVHLPPCKTSLSGQL